VLNVKTRCILCKYILSNKVNITYSKKAVTKRKNTSLITVLSENMKEVQQ